MVGRTVRATVRRLCGVARGDRRICGSRRGFRSGRRFHLGRSARRGGGVAGYRADDQTGADRDVRKSQSRTGITPEMKILRPISILISCLMLTANAAAQISLTPPGAADTPPAADKPAAKPKAKPPAQAKKPPAPAATAKPAPPVAAPVATVAPAPPPDDPNADLVYGAYQRGQYKTAFDLASKRAQDFSDPKAMTMLGELY